MQLGRGAGSKWISRSGAVGSTLFQPTPTAVSFQGAQVVHCSRLTDTVEVRRKFYSGTFQTVTFDILSNGCASSASRCVLFGRSRHFWRRPFVG